MIHTTISDATAMPKPHRHAEAAIGRTSGPAEAWAGSLLVKERRTPGRKSLTNVVTIISKLRAGPGGDRIEARQHRPAAEPVASSWHGQDTRSMRRLQARPARRAEPEDCSRQPL